VQKLIRVSKSIEENVQNEVNTLDYLSRQRYHDNIIEIFQHWWLETARSVLFIDMELADLSLSDYVNYISRNESLPI
jgi:hypothetical protein